MKPNSHAACVSIDRRHHARRRRFPAQVAGASRGKTPRPGRSNLDTEIGDGTPPRAAPSAPLACACRIAATVVSRSSARACRAPLVRRRIVAPRAQRRAMHGLE
ncbi:hypothetical protein GSH05_13705 [Burkholderia pseudomallei]|nr:hypothetical protein X941_5818 [Burkholderia pseudomallei MSHR5569]MBM5594868.1 hypothetical protein [Burkholderia pseudomallei]MBM5652682.1 hypothetical protein [Burkholderia pseudomallei]